MKRIIILIIILMSPLLVFAEDNCDNSSINIKSINLINSSNTTSEITNATISNNIVNLNLRVNQVNDFAEYEFIIENKTNKDLYIDNNTIKSNNNYINYRIKIDNTDNVLKPNKETKVNLKISYDKETTESIVNSNDNLSFYLIDENPIKNPVTGNSIIYIVLLLMLVLMFVFLLRKNKSKYSNLVLIIVALLLIYPISTKAICKIDIKVNSSVEINKKFTGTIYRYDQKIASIGKNLTGEEWCEEIPEYGRTSCEYNISHNSKEECELNRSNQSNNCIFQTLSMETVFGSYTFNPKELEKDYYLKHIIVDDVLTESYVCLNFDKEYCLRGGVVEYDVEGYPIYNQNKEIINSIKDNFDNCSISDTAFTCTGGKYSKVKADISGYTDIFGYDDYACSIGNGVCSKCDNTNH